MTDTDLLDPIILASLRELLGANFSALVDAYITDCEAKIERMNTAYAASDLMAIRDEAHGIKGSSRNLGANTLADVCGIIETQTRDGTVENLDQKLSAVQQLFAAVRQELSAMLPPV